MSGSFPVSGSVIVWSRLEVLDDSAFVLSSCSQCHCFSAAGGASFLRRQEYDENKPVVLTGTVTKLEWMNPHARFYVDIKDASGKVTNWEFELGGVNGLIRRGWTRTSLKPGDVVTVDGFLTKDGSPLVNAKTVTLSGGKKVFSGSSRDDAEWLKYHE